MADAETCLGHGPFKERAARFREFMRELSMTRRCDNCHGKWFGED